MNKLTPPTCFRSGEVKLSDELKNLLNDLTDFFSQPCDDFYNANLVLSNNEWVPIPEVIGGRRRLDVQFDLVKLVDVKIYSNLIMFTLNDGSIYSLRLTKDFFYFMEWEESYYK